MSIKMMAMVWERMELKEATLLLALALADYASDSGECWPAIPSLARKARVSRRHAQRIVRDLRDAGLLAVSVGAGPKGANVYTLHLGGDITSPDAHVVHDAQTRATPEGEGGDIGDTLGATRRSPKPSVEPSTEPSQKNAAAATTRRRAREEDGDPRLAALATHYENTIGGLTPTIADLMADWVDRIPDTEIGERWVAYAFREAAASAHPCWAYVQGVLLRGESQGWPADMEGRRNGDAKDRPGVAGKGARVGTAARNRGPDLDQWDAYARGDI